MYRFRLYLGCGVLLAASLLGCARQHLCSDADRCRTFSEHFQVYDAFTESLKLDEDGKLQTSEENLKTMRRLWDALVKESVSCYGEHEPT